MAPHWLWLECTFFWNPQERIINLDALHLQLTYNSYYSTFCRSTSQKSCEHLLAFTNPRWKCAWTHPLINRCRFLIQTKWNAHLNIVTLNFSRGIFIFQFHFLPNFFLWNVYFSGNSILQRLRRPGDRKTNESTSDPQDVTGITSVQPHVTRLRETSMSLYWFSKWALQFPIRVPPPTFISLTGLHLHTVAAMIL